MRILTDRHHQALTESLRLLFEKRLGHTLKFQKGMEWYPDYFAVYPHIETAKQYLERELEGLDGITLEDFKNTKFDILIASLPQHIEPFKKLISFYQPQAKLIYQIGNDWGSEIYGVNNIMASAKVNFAGTNLNIVSYHQEFDLNIFHYAPPDPATKKIYSFINCLNVVDLYKKDWELFLELEKLMPDWEFKSYGGQCREGAIWDRKELADKMREATFIYQCKSMGDGYGHVIHNAAAIGRPLITRRSDYNGKLAEALLYERSSIEVDNKTPQQIAGEIQNYTDEQIKIKSQIINSNFKHAVDFDAEEQKIRLFLDKLQ